MSFFSKKHQKGFSLVELMVVVAIISILAALALPRFQIFQAKARTSEAKANLQMIYTLQQAYHGENDEYVNISGIGGSAEKCSDILKQNDLGFRPEPCKSARYTYTVTDASRTGFTAQAQADEGVINPSCKQIKDTWVLTVASGKEKTIEHTQNAVICKE